MAKVNVKKFGDRYDDGFIEVTKSKQEQPPKKEKPNK